MSQLESCQVVSKLGTKFWDTRGDAKKLVCAFLGPTSLLSVIISTGQSQSKLVLVGIVGVCKTFGMS